MSIGMGGIMAQVASCDDASGFVLSDLGASDGPLPEACRSCVEHAAVSGLSAMLGSAFPAGMIIAVACVARCYEQRPPSGQARMNVWLLGVSVVLVGILGIIFGRRRASGKEMDTAKGPQTAFNKHGVLDGMDDLELAADADMHANEEEEEADEDMLSVNLDRNGII